MPPPSEAGFVGDLRAARRVLRARRGAVHATGWGQVLQDWYVGLFVTVTMLTMLFAATGGAILTPDCDAVTCLDARGYRMLALGMGTIGLLGAGAALRAAGPASSDPGRAAWLLSTPADRGVLLRGPILRTVLVVLVGGTAWAVLVGFALAGGSGSTGAALPVLATAGAGLLATLALVPPALRRQGGAWGLSGAARAVPDAELARAGQVVGAVTASTLMLDTAALEGLATRRRLARRGRYASGRAVGGALPGVLVHELRAVRRRAGRVVLGLGACVLALALGLLLGSLAGMVGAALAVVALARVAGGGVSTWVGNPGLRRAVPAHPAAVTAVLALPPLLLALLGSALAFLGLGLPWWAPVLLALGATAGAVRAADAPPGLGVALATPAGAVHTGLVLRLLLGTDLALIAGLLVLVADAQDLGPLVLVAGAGLLGWQVLRAR